MKKNPMLLKNILSRRKKPERIVIGIIGTHAGVGATHIGIMLSNYLGNYMGAKTAYLEMNSKDELKYLQYAYEGNFSEQDTKKQFKIHNSTYFLNVRELELINIYNQNYEYLILDFGTDFINNKNEFLRCDIKLVIGSLAEWKKQYLYNFVDSKKQLPGFGSWKILIVFGQEKDLKIASHELHIKLDKVSYEPDPFLLSQEIIKLFQKIIFS